ncbi:DNA-formamidopyrimidine glycosylase family protein [Pinibacter aurantiacus]|uniref:Endonuclease n=1 Tax=Pinibacter aurantiacus TaxID=2851599 RepID=A0A9E2S5P7_9BACT|nr:DNA-formamidopyrimidine glycosylase family protein [Pinibacter aurantiacus]MBV4356481.1 endonuclease [Pinibacter aurantiacus]
MPEGPSIVIFKEEVQGFKRKKIIAVSGNTAIEKERMLNQTVVDFKSWGKHFLICFKAFSLRVHFMLFGSYRINEKKDAPARLSLQFTNGEINFYACSVQFVEGNVNDTYDWSVDVMSDEWDPVKARKKLKANPDMLVCDALLDQHIFSGVGNIIKNEVLFRIKVHPESKIGNLPPKKLSELIKEARVYSFQFLEWKKAFVLKKHWLAHTKKICPRDHIPFIKKHLGKTHRRTFYCEMCQVRY